MRAERQEIHVPGLHIRRRMRHGLRPVTDDDRSVFMGNPRHFLDRRDIAQHIGDIRDSNDLHLLMHRLAEVLQRQPAILRQGNVFKLRAGFLHNFKPRQDVGRVFRLRRQNHVARL